MGRFGRGKPGRIELPDVAVGCDACIDGRVFLGAWAVVPDLK